MQFTPSILSIPYSRAPKSCITISNSHSHFSVTAFASESHKFGDGNAARGRRKGEEVGDAIAEGDSRAMRDYSVDKPSEFLDSLQIYQLN
ncbi:hypothetical protein Trydic_g8781 [Trypoxylus dichotomus]